MRYKADSIEGVSRQPEGGRSLTTYELALGFDREELKGKQILDLGIGPEAKLAKQLAEASVDSKVVGISPDLESNRHRQRLQQANHTAQAVAALGQELPFRGETFDVVLALHVVDHLPSENDFKRIVTEIVRVLKNNGVARIGPLFRQSYFNSYRLLGDNEFIDMLKLMGVAVIEEKISEAYGKEKIYDEQGMGMGSVPYSRMVLRKNKNG